MLIKRLFDILASVCGLVLLFPVLLVICICVRTQMGSPVIFSQIRPGRHGHSFKMYKFRTMTSEVDEQGDLLPDELRLTRFGQLLRSSSLDELPELWNVLKGEMSIVGPRPLLVDYLSLYSERQARRHEVKPGITGWAQVNGRNNLSWPERFELDVWYVENRSLWLDIKIIFLTIWKVFRREGISQDGEVTMTPFLGNYPDDFPENQADSDVSRSGYPESSPVESDSIQKPSVKVSSQRSDHDE